MAMSMMTSVAISAAGSRESLKSILQTMPMLRRDGHYLFMDGEAITGGLAEAEARDLAGRLARLEGQSLGGGRFVSDGDRNMLFLVDANDGRAGVQHVIKGDWNFTPPDTVKTLLLTGLSSLGSLWKQAA
jgi:hypothetical protein